jgi:transposase
LDVYPKRGSSRIVDERDKTIRSLRAENEALKSQIVVLMARIAELERRLNINSQNSNKPPSSDGPRKPRTKSLRTSGNKRSGGQPGHKGTTLKQVADPDHVVQHPVHTCASCLGDLSDVSSSNTQKRQVFDIPKPRIEVTEHQTESKDCPKCGHCTISQFPEDITAPVQYGLRIRALSVYFNQHQMLPEDRLSDMFGDVFGLSISSATIASYSARASLHLNGWVAQLTNYLASCPVKHLDETGFRIGGKTQWLHVMSTQQSTVYRVDPKRGAMFSNLRGILVHDHFKSYYRLTNVEHALCNAHHLRELKALIDIEGESWAYQMSALLRVANKHPERSSWCHRVYDIIVEQGLHEHEKMAPIGDKPRRGRRKRRIGHNLLLRFQQYKSDVFRFLTHANVPFTNNQSEQDARMMKVRMKISGTFRSADGARIFANIRSFTSTCRKRGLGIYSAIVDLFQGKLPSVFETYPTPLLLGSATT